ncbi:Fe-S cluster assembly protein SufD [Schleiferilactobacillus perolens]|jgi:Fe-S cluster assembly protein SufD|uniref:Fe-S cluster assembly protein SufD n=1 Tax=Schleiferilactobacillus perolens TaxID=100468 RepID=UPI0023550C12|nr:Fe-S cluster assembly protein SufD [Schleiferilactobacillus perolens]MCI2172000.1 Fe-S cluster assembly protein SufD [Schleiferilactobacillus perolens]
MAFGPKTLAKQAIQDQFGPRDHSAWLTAQRLAAAKIYETAPWPDFPKVQFHAWPLFGAPAADAGIRYPDGLPDQKDGLLITPLLDAAIDQMPWATQYLFQEATVKDRLTAFHVAQINSGLLIHVPDHFHQEDPIVLNTELLAGRTAHHHVLVVVGEDAQVTIVDRYTGEVGAKSGDSVVTELVVGAGSRVNYANVDAFDDNITAFIRRQATVAQGGVLNWTGGVLNDGNVLVDTSTDLVGTGAEADVKMVALASGKQIQGMNTRITNIGRQTTANILQHGVILENATLVFNGIGHIVKGASGADAQQENRVLMLSRTAHGDANPILLIDENDVKAGHAASVGRVDESQMYYLMSRGLSRDLAQRLVIRGFLGAVLTAIPLPAVQKDLIDTIERKLIHGQAVAHAQE